MTYPFIITWVDQETIFLVMNDLIRTFVTISNDNTSACHRLERGAGKATDLAAWKETYIR